ncbi:hypothetical protein SEMRO_2235_G320200.1 [Seminavis robusta]|uniref:Uncharacterized protein n=1 Tax=Seminavis robusta TaxID=568900 RepID=A0A9N8HZC7_9STRA|nr:hypothetical protein SEMRO_2235_G320200.1 [Seminavis robusta]|eukprot:Sro2235_g320200.1 n/a (524) ;mRNA; f:12530-14101
MSKRPASEYPALPSQLTRQSSSDSSEEEAAPESSVGQPWAKSTTLQPPAEKNDVPRRMDFQPPEPPPASPATFKTAKETLSACKQDQKKALMLCMCLGIMSEDGTRWLGDLTVEPYCKLSTSKLGKLSRTKPMMSAEVTRRAIERNVTKAFPRPKNWRNETLEKHLKVNPIVTQEDITFLRSQENALFHACENMIVESAQQEAAEAKQSAYRWNDSDPRPFYRMYLAAEDDQVKAAMVEDGKCLSKAKLDGRNSEDVPITFFAALTDKWNSDWVARTPVLPNLHGDFEEEIVIGPDDVKQAATTEYITKKWKNDKMLLARLVSRYEGSGHGFGMIDGRPVFGHMTEEALQADDRKDYLWEQFSEKPRHLLLWHLSDQFGILNHVITRMSQATSATGEDVATSTSKTKKQRTKQKQKQKKKAKRKKTSDESSSDSDQDAASKFRSSLAESQQEQAYQSAMENLQTATTRLTNDRLDLMRHKRHNPDDDESELLLAEQVRLQTDIVTRLHARVEALDKKKNKKSS